jgi:hypothetical protein
MGYEIVRLRIGFQNQAAKVFGLLAHGCKGFCSSIIPFPILEEEFLTG